MHRWRNRIVKLMALALVAGAASAPSATAKSWSERAGEPATPTECAAWSAAMARGMALYGLTGAQAAEYLASRLDNPCHRTLTTRSLFHAGDPA
jgi:hypothetical protein